ncbi:MAG: 1-acyl-sn-glycerol-3-phosphate acyltransferase [Clostridia bacterium]|nr:1-acyl-sn-glycerol-3-phosphate acyltransferase [Clostridia bacterium]
MKKVRYYREYTDDFSVSKSQDFTLPDSYVFIKNDFLSRLLSAVVYFLAIVFSSVYLRLFMHLKITGKKKFRKVSGGYFIYGNHTQSVGDVFIPALAALPRRIYTIVSTANYGIPVIGKILRPLGALPIISTIKGMRNLEEAIKKRALTGHPIVIYPEAHVWDYYTGIRPFSDTSFKFPVKLNLPAFSMTSTYRKSKLFKKPVINVIIDGPFYPEGETVKEKAKDLHGKIYNSMCENAKESNFNYVEYKKNGD